MSEPTNDFKDLKRLLKLKRHEIPPPGYFDGFSGNVISRIKAGEEGGAILSEQYGSDSILPAIFRLLRMFQLRRRMVGGFATSLCVLLLIGVVLVDHSDSGLTNAMASNTQTGAGEQTTAMASTVSLAPPDENSGIALSSNGMTSLQPVVTLFSPQQQNPLFQQVSFMPAQQ